MTQVRKGVVLTEEPKALFPADHPGLIEDSLRVVCEKAPDDWEALWLGPLDVFKPTVPNFCPWCNGRISDHNSYRRQVVTGSSEAMGE